MESREVLLYKKLMMCKLEIIFRIWTQKYDTSFSPRSVKEQSSKMCVFLHSPANTSGLYGAVWWFTCTETSLWIMEENHSLFLPVFYSVSNSSNYRPYNLLASIFVTQHKYSVECFLGLFGVWMCEVAISQFAANPSPSPPRQQGVI